MSPETISPSILVHIGPVEITSTIVYTLVASGILVGLALFIRAGFNRRPSAWQVAAEFVLEYLETVMRDMFGRDPRPYTPLIATLALFIGVANLTGLVPGLHAATADISTTIALAVIVFVAVPFYGIRAKGLRGYLRHYLDPVPVLMPLEIVSELSRTLALAVRLFGNIMSEELIIAVLILLAGFLVPVPLMLLAVLTSVVQAYIFAMLAIVYLSGALRAQEK